jgi:hypothetical protein
MSDKERREAANKARIIRLKAERNRERTKKLNAKVAANNKAENKKLVRERTWPKETEYNSRKRKK